MHAFYFLRVLKRSGVDQSSLIKVYTTCLRPVLEYGCQIWNYNSPDYLKEEIERIQRRALRIICPHLSYNKALITNNIPLLSQRRNDLCKSHFKKLLNPNHKLNELIPQRRKDFFVTICLCNYLTFVSCLWYFTLNISLAFYTGVLDMI